MNDYDRVIAECMAEYVDQTTPPKPCNSNLNCLLAGGCPGCLHTKPRRKP